MNITDHAKLIKQMEQSGQDTAGETLRLYLDHLPLVKMFARPFTRQQELEDLLQEAYPALIDALRYYDPAKNVSFSYVWGFYLKKSYQSMAAARPHVPYNTITDVRRYKAITAEYVKKYGVQPPPEYYQEHFTAAELKSIDKALLCEDVASLEKPVTEDGGSFADILEDPNADPAGEAIERAAAEQLRRVWELVNQITTPEQAEVLRAIYMDGMKTKETPMINKLYQRGLGRLKRNADKFIPYLELSRLDYLSEGLKHKGVQSFHRTRESATEAAALKAIEQKEAVRQMWQKFKEELQSGLCADFKKVKRNKGKRKENNANGDTKSYHDRNRGSKAED